MMRSRPPSPPSTVRRPLRKRLASSVSLACVVALCVLAAGALFAPTFVFGSESGSRHPGPEMVVESTDQLSAPTARNEAAATGASTVVPTTTVARVAGADGSEATAAGPATVPAGVDPGTLLVTLPWGTDSGEVGLARPVEGLTRGPEALAVAPDGRIVVLDSVNKRVVFLDSSGRVVGTAAVPLSEPRFLAVTGDRVYVLDCDSDHRLLTLYWSGAVCGRALLPDLPDVVTGLFATRLGPCVEVAHAIVYRIANRTPGKTLGGDVSGSQEGSLQSTDLSLSTVSGRPVGSEFSRLVTARFAPGGAPTLTSYVVGTTGTASQSSNLDLAVPDGRSIEHLLSVDGDLGGNVVVGARLLDDADPSVPASLLLTRFVLADDGSINPATSPAGASTSLLLADLSSAYVGQPYAVAPDGRVFQPVATELGYSIFVHTFSNASSPAVDAEVQP